MLFPFMVTPDKIRVLYSDIINKAEKECVRLKFERWNINRKEYDSMECILPDGEMSNIIGFTKGEAENCLSHMINLQDMILECSREDTKKWQWAGVAIETCEKCNKSMQVKIAMKDKVDVCLDSYLDIVKDLYGDNLIKVILYGSYARGDFQEGSDVDLLILIDTPPQDERKQLSDLIDKTFDVKLDNNLDIEPLVKSIHTYEKWKDVLPLFKNIDLEGKVLYER